MKEKPINRKALIISVGSILFIILAFISIQKILTIGKILTRIQFLPSNVLIYIDDEQVQNNTEILLEKGNHKVLVSLENYNTISETVSISENNSNLYGYLIPNSVLYGDVDELDKYMEVQERALYNINETTQQQLIDAFPIYNYLPYNSTVDPFSIYADLSDNNMDITITIKQAHPDVLSEIDMACLKLKEIYEKNNLKITPSQNNITILNLDNKLKNFTNNQEEDPYKFINTGYNSIADFIYVFSGERKDDYYYTLIRYNNPNNEYDSMLYRILLKKDGNSWQLVNTPYPMLTIYNTKDTPYTILDSANNYSYSSRNY